MTTTQTQNQKSLFLPIVVTLEDYELHCDNNFFGDLEKNDPDLFKLIDSFFWISLFDDTDRVKEINKMCKDARDLWRPLDLNRVEARLARSL